MQVQDFALAGKKIVFDVEPVHGFKMPAQHGNGDQFGDDGSFCGRILNGVQRLQADLQILLVFRVPLRDPGIQIPAVVVKAWFFGKSLDLRTRFLLDLSEANHYIGHLHAGVVDVILNVDFPARKTQEPNECIPENCIAQMSNVRGLVGIDARVLDQNLACGNGYGRLLVCGEGSGHPSTVDLDVQIPRGRRLHFCNALDRANLSLDRFSDLQGSRPQRLGEGKNGNREVAQFDLWRLFHDHPTQGHAWILALQTLQHALGETMFQMTIQEVPLSD